MLILNETSQKLILKEMNRKGRFHHTYAHVRDILEVLHSNKEKFSKIRAHCFCIAHQLHTQCHEIVQRVQQLENC